MATEPVKPILYLVLHGFSGTRCAGEASGKPVFSGASVKNHYMEDEERDKLSTLRLWQEHVAGKKDFLFAALARARARTSAVRGHGTRTRYTGYLHIYYTDTGALTTPDHH